MKAAAPKLCPYPCRYCGQTLYFIDMASPARHCVVRAEACVTLDGRVPRSGERVACPNCGREAWFY